MKVRLGALAVVCSCAVAAAAQQQPSIDRLLVRVGDYAATLEQRLAGIVSNERYQQTASFGEPRKRTIEAEMLFWWLPEEHVWLSVRNVLRVDGHVTTGSDKRLEQAFQAVETTDLRAQSASHELSGPVIRTERLKALQEESGRFDLLFDRSTGNPTIVLQFVLPENQLHFAFTDGGRTKVNGMPARKINFEERGVPTVVTVAGQDVVSRGAIWVREADGTVLKTNLSVHVSTPNRRGRTVPAASITVEFRDNVKLDTWVPVQMEEHYQGLNCTSMFDNYRRFETSGRILNPQR